MALSLSDLAQIRQALNTLSDEAIEDLGYVLDSLVGQAEHVGVRRALADAWVDVLGEYGQMSATLAADVFRWQASDLGVRATTKMASLDADEANARFGWVLTTSAVIGNAKVLADELVKQPYRDTFARSAVASKAGWARVPTGVTCAFCVMLASRGIIHTDESYARRYHGSCDCSVILVRGTQDYPDNYRPDVLYREYLDARKAAGSGDTSAILSEMRRQLGVN